MNLYEKYLRWKNDKLRPIDYVSGYEVELFNFATEQDIERFDKYLNNLWERKVTVIIIVTFILGFAVGSLLTVGSMLNNM